MKIQARECLLIFGMGLLFATAQLGPTEFGAFRFVTVIAIGAASTLVAALAPELEGER